MERKTTAAYTVGVNEQQGIVETIFSVFGNIDLGKDRLHPGTFSKTFQERGLKVRVLDQHQSDSVLHVVGKPLAMRELTREELPPELLAQYPEATGGAWAQVKFLLDTPEGLGVFKRLQEGVVDQWSFGYDPVLAEYSTVDTPHGKQTIREIHEVRLLELSPVIWAMNPGTATLSAKATDEAKVKPGDDESEDDFMARCIPAMVEEGREQEQAVAMCASMFAQATEGEDEEKRKRRRRKIPAAGTGAVNAVVLDSADPPEEAKAANVADWFESGIHQHFTMLADDLFMNGLLTREERIGLSGLIGDALDVFHNGLQGELFADMRTRRPGTETKAGRRVRKAKLEEARAAMGVLVDFLKWADYDESETPDEGDDEKKPKAAAGPDLHPRQKQAMIERLKLELTEV